MNKVEFVRWLPAADQFVSELVERVQAGYSKALVPIGKAIVSAGGDRERMVEFVGSPSAKAAFLLGCCAEEVASLSDRLQGQEEKEFLRAVINELGQHADSLKARRISPDFRRLYSSFREVPTRSRVQTLSYMLDVNGLAEINEIVAADPVCQLAIECTAMTDGIAGVLLDLVGHIESKGVNPRRWPGDRPATA